MLESRLSGIGLVVSNEYGNGLRGEGLDVKSDMPGIGAEIADMIGEETGFGSAGAEVVDTFKPGSGFEIVSSRGDGLGAEILIGFAAGISIGFGAGGRGIGDDPEPIPGSGAEMRSNIPIG